MQELTLPNLGDGIASGDVLKILVKIGETVKKDQAVVELETDKATVEVPSTAAGVVKEIRVKAGDKVQPGQVVLILDEGGEGAKAPEAPAAKSEPQAAPKDPDQSPEVRAEVRADEGRDTPAAPADETKPGSEESGPAAAAPPDADRPRASVVDINQGRPAGTSMAPSAAIGPATPVAPAAPSVRRLAREIGVDINVVTGTGSGGRISQDDVKAFSKQVLSSLGSSGQVAMAGAAAPSARPGFPSVPLPDFAKWGDVERKPMSGIRRKTAEHLSRAWTAIPHVTQFDKADITTLEQVRKKYRAEVEKAGGNLTVTAVATRVIAGALRVFPQFNASVDMAAEAIVYKKYINVGIAVDTDNGLLVPVIRDADKKNLTELSVEIHQLAEKAKARKLSIDDMSGGSMSISNLGGIGGTAFTPIVNWPEVAILGISRAAFEPVWNGTTFEPRQMLPLSLSYDHRLVDGADAIRFLRWVAEALENPFALTLRG